MADRYSFSLTTFSPSGKLKQIEHALAAVKQGVTSLGIKATNGIVLATERKSTSVLVQADFVDKIVHVTPDIGMTYAGMGPDFRVLTDKSRKVSHTNYKRIYNEYPPTKILVSEVAKVMQDATQSAGVRPYGVSLLLGGYDENSGFMLYQVDPSGSYFPWKATAIGKGSNAAKTFLEKRWNEELELEDAIHIALLTLKESIEGEMNGDTVEIAVIGAENDDQLGFQGAAGVHGPRFRKLSPKEINDRLETL
ncbi:Proteasome subunit alpha type-2 [Ogataea parapolymorpha DL-1]|uniref:Proteasome subunit alpha type n=1 Tax=Ogataea parapolymorpha (strain ATCC 26012 / BCRC 20466 / JCM 22074 / NRRL Y-7560 / DL-1) TaxID=871575 RepID=W1QGC6_OGAPD|nr:Proteasome subunit alpha type-2 [Ogataea parapolymorpha DL-1]ESX00130.1 Proteasome subunit alpha type-2 [Ogataea parapolymorpha DL-1]